MENRGNIKSMTAVNQTNPQLNDANIFSLQKEAMQKLHEEEMRKKDAECKKVKTKLDKCTTFIKNLKEKHDILKLENEILERKITEFESEAGIKVDEDVSITSEHNPERAHGGYLRNLIDRCEMLNSKCEEKNKIIESQDNFIQELNTKSEKLEQINKHLKECCKLTKNLQKQLKECSFIEKKNNAVNEKTIELNQIENELVSKENKILKSELEILKTKVGSSDKTIKFKNWRIDTLNNQLKKCQNRNGEESDDKSNLDHEEIVKVKKALASELIHTKNLFSSLKTKHEKVKAEFSDLQGQLKIKNAYNKELDIKINALYNRQIQKEADEEKSILRIKTETENLTEMYEKENKGLREELEKFKSDYSKPKKLVPLFTTIVKSNIKPVIVKRKSSNIDNELPNKTQKNEQKQESKKVKPSAILYPCT